ncbi:MAG TPA: hypothetical protein VMY87_06175 [Armatimonadota bacterium]|nr:hypothetical protein [Armatimonadota bacterium]
MRGKEDGLTVRAVLRAVWYGAVCLVVTAAVYAVIVMLFCRFD